MTKYFMQCNTDFSSLESKDKTFNKVFPYDGQWVEAVDQWGVSGGDRGSPPVLPDHHRGHQHNIGKPDSWHSTVMSTS